MIKNTTILIIYKKLIKDRSSNTNKSFQKTFDCSISFRSSSNCSLVLSSFFNPLNIDADGFARVNSSTATEDPNLEAKIKLFSKILSRWDQVMKNGINKTMRGRELARIENCSAKL